MKGNATLECGCRIRLSSQDEEAFMERSVMKLCPSTIPGHDMQRVVSLDGPELLARYFTIGR